MAPDEATWKGFKEAMFHQGDIVERWYDISTVIEGFGFDDKLVDKEKIEEHRYITNQLNKFIGTKQEEILVGELDIEKGIEAVRKIISDCQDVKDTRVGIVYAFMRNEWLASLLALMEEMKFQAEAEVNSGW